MYILDKRKAIILVVLYTTAVADCYTCVRIKVAINSTHHQNLLVMSPSSATTPTKKLNYIVSEHCGECSYSIFSSIIIFQIENLTNIVLQIVSQLFVRIKVMTSLINHKKLNHTVMIKTLHRVTK